MTKPAENDAQIDFEALWNSLPSPTILLMEGQGLVAANAAAEQFFAMSERALRESDFIAFAPEGSRFIELLEQAQRTGTSLAERGVDIFRRDGSTVLVDLQINAFSDNKNESSTLIVFQPRSIAEKMDRSLAHRGAARSVSGMSAALAHEVKNPLAAITGAAQLIQDSASDQESELASLIDEEAGRIRRLIDRMEHFTDPRPPEPEPVNLHDALNMTRRAAEAGFARGVRFVEEYDPSLPPTVGDRDQLARAFQNLVKNAADAVDSKGEITLKTAFRPGVRLVSTVGNARHSLPLEVSIIDNGPGIPEELAPHVFEPFVTSKSAGVGLGLALVSKIVADHGGVIEFDSGSGRTIFRVLLPVWKDPATLPIDEEGDA